MQRARPLRPGQYERRGVRGSSRTDSQWSSWLAPGQASVMSSMQRLNQRLTLQASLSVQSCRRVCPHLHHA
jgi:hypothetical protein